MATTGDDTQRLPASSEVVVIGGGFIGCSVAYQLAKRGVAVALIEREHIAWGASGRNAGQVSPAAGYTDAFLPFTVANFAMLRTMEEELEADFHFRLTGGMEIITEPDEIAGIAESAAALRHAGWHAEVLDGDEARRRVPALGPRVVAGRYVAESAHLTPMALAYGFARAAGRYGALICTETTVTGITADTVGVRAVVTNRGTIATPIVINATNGWAEQIAAMVGISLPIQPQRGQILVTAPTAPLLPMTFGYWAEGAIHYWRQTTHGGIVIGGGRAYDTAGIGSYSRRNTFDIMRRFPAHVARTMPVLAHLPVERVWAGTMGFTPDYGPLIGPCAAVTGFYVAAGFNGNGTPWSCIAGLLIAQMVCGQSSHLPLDRIAADRFAHGVGIV